jgi:beta-N-acetylhexosaminidase
VAGVRPARVRAGLCVALALLVTGCALPAETSPAASGTERPGSAHGSPATDSCEALAASLPVEQQVGQLFMVGIESTAPAVTKEISVLVSSGRVGAVILVGNTTGGRQSVSLLTTQLSSLSKPDLPVIIAADQEGGLVQRLQGPGFDTIPSAVEQAKMPDDKLAESSMVWGSQLQAAGVQFNLTPVADVVPAEIGTRNQPIGALRRGFGSDPNIVADKVVSVVDGYARANVATSVKHFPNLGAVIGNTDTTERVVDSVTGPDSPLLEGFRAGIDAGANSVMMSNAVYSLIDPDNPAVFSPAVMRLLRDDLGFTRVVISDDLGAAAAVKGVPAAERAKRFLVAGGDLALNVDAATLLPMYEEVLRLTRSDADFAADVTTKAARVLRLKSEVGLVGCT